MANLAGQSHNGWRRAGLVTLVVLILWAGLGLRCYPLAVLAPPGPGEFLTGPWSWHEADPNLRLLGGPDAYYHLRRARLASAGQTLAHDNWTNFPYGSDIHWPAGYAKLLGYIADTFGNRGGRQWLPVTAGMLALVVVIPLLYRRYGSLAGYPLLVMALAPANVFPTTYAAIDHHCLELLFSLLAVAGLAAGRWSGIAIMAAALAGAWATVPSWPLPVAVIIAGLAVQRLPSWSAAAALLLITGGFLAASAFYLLDPWLSAVAEAQPLLSVGAFFRAIVALSPGFLLLPVAALWWWRVRQERAAAGLLAMTAITLPLVFIEARFVLFLTLPAAAALMETLRWLHRRGARKSAVLLAVLCLLPLGRGLAELPEWSRDIPGAAETARYLLEFIPTLAGDPGQPLSTPAYGVAARWDWGHHLLALSGIPVAANPFHTGTAGRALAHGIFFCDPATATALADSAAIRILVLEDFAASGYADRYRDAGNVPLYLSLWYRLYYDNDQSLGWRLHGKPTLDGTVQVWVRD